MKAEQQNNHFAAMQQHPQDFRDEELETLMDEMDREPDVEAMWQRFEAAHYPHAARRGWVWQRVAAVLLAGAFLGGLAYAVVRAKTQTQTETQTQTKTQTQTQTQTQTGEASVVLYDDVPLAQVLEDFAQHYHIRVEYSNPEAGDIRLHFQWDREASLADNLATLNAFERIHLSLKTQTQTQTKTQTKTQTLIVE